MIRTADQLPTSRTVGRNVAALRRRNGWSLRTLSHRTAAAGKHIGVATIIRIEQASDDTRPVAAVSADNLVVLATVLGRRPEQLLTDPNCQACHDIPPPGFTCDTCSTPPPATDTPGEPQ